MKSLPIVARELREASRRRATYWLRALVAFQAILVGIVGFLMNFFNPAVKLGTVLFWGVAGISMLFCLLAGRRSTADCLSQEKRDGTLGLLFLTDLKGYDVVLGKLAATSVSGLYALLAVFPVMAVPLVTGGMTRGEVERMVVVLITTFFFSIAIGIFASAVSREYRAAMAANFFLWLALVAAPAAAGIGLGIARSKILPPFFYSCPIFSFILCEDTNYVGMPDDFWWSICATNILAWGLVVLACRVVPRTWGDKPSRPPSSKWQWKDLGWRMSYGGTAGRVAFRKRALDANAYFWLAARARLKMVHVWVFVGIAALWWFVCWAKNGSFWLDEATFFATALVLNSTFKLWITLEAGQRLGEDRRAGGFELLLATPLTVRDILGGQLMALRRQFLKPLVVVLCVETVFLAVLWHKPDERWMFVAMMLILPMDIAALVCVAMRAALTSKSPTRTNVIAVSQILVLPWAVFGAIQGVESLLDALGIWRWEANTPVQVAQWCAISLVVDLFFGVQAWRSLRREFRALATATAESRFSLREFAALAASWMARIIPPRFRIQAAATASLVVALAIFYWTRPAPMTPPVIASLAQSNGPVRIFRSGPGGAMFVLPDGSLWRWGYTEVLRARAAMPEQIGSNYNWVKAVGNGRYWFGLRSDGTIVESGLRGMLSGSDWVDIAVSHSSPIGLAKDGTIRTLGEKTPGWFVTSSNWVAVACPNNSYLALRADGTLWVWGTVISSLNGVTWLGTNIPEPVLLCAASNWVGLDASGQAQNRAGELWDVAFSFPNPNLPPASVCRLVSTNWAADRIQSGSHWMSARIAPDGTLWSTLPAPNDPLVSRTPLRKISTRADWDSIWVVNGTGFGMTSDGTLWAWGNNLGQDPPMNLQALRNRLVGRRAYAAGGALPIWDQPHPLIKLTPLKD
ncbi:MAG TPA: ABC transporter permease subunit [Verrucomicrobiae bacterium]|nr:ABC transporter permease subunit [Verrucomicrobiae bacterium]